MKKLACINRGFTLIELLIAISIVGILVAISAFGLSGARESARDGRRKADLELIRSGLELYKSDCNSYPETADFPNAGISLVGDDVNCPDTNIYINSVPGDSKTDRKYSYARVGTGYALCATLEQAPNPAMTGLDSCGSCTLACNYIVINP